ncbi:hydrogenase small subunit [Oceanirhabdus seepicola]|uniref:Hydrogenase small subunit n=1 Tax=Oceanirhabdus seepicola TaxID=2828781 RepID=A0A9J6NYK7_9CLOT|nr:hydrogenase small subunit [Oceanirhabdus seepicola]MCM1988717.1 hydrogenase small subunit [Oceanirhabdus seepicola]
MARTMMDMVMEKKNKKINLIWLETCGCSGNIISLLNANNPDVVYFLKEMVNLRYSNSLMAADGEIAYEQFLKILETEFILVVEGAISTKDQGLYNVIANYKGSYITGMEAVKKAGEKAKYILAVGTCASFGGISAASPNVADCKGVKAFLNKEVIQLPGCPGNPDWIIGTIAHLILSGKPELDEKERPVIFYGVTIHDHCPRRSYFDKRIFAKKLGDDECMFRLGCRGPVTKTDCPNRRWNDTDNWPIGVNTPCIGCAQEGFPDKMEPFIRY